MCLSYNKWQMCVWINNCTHTQLLQKSQAITVKQKQICTLADGLKDQEVCTCVYSLVYSCSYCFILLQKTLLKERGKLLASTRMDQVTDDNRRLGKISQLGQENIGFDATITSTGGQFMLLNFYVRMYVCVHMQIQQSQMLCLILHPPLMNQLLQICQVHTHAHTHTHTHMCTRAHAHTHTQCTTVSYDLNLENFTKYMWRLSCYCMGR